MTIHYTTFWVQKSGQIQPNHTPFVLKSGQINRNLDFKAFIINTLKSR